MKIAEVHIKNFRALENVTINLEDELSVIVGKNNTGKTSFIKVLGIFLGEGEFSFDDFSIKARKEIERLIEGSSKKPKKYNNEIAISLELHMRYGNQDKLDKVSDLIMDLDDQSHTLILRFEYVLNGEKYKRMLEDFKEYKNVGRGKEFNDFIKSSYKDYFKKVCYAIDPTTDSKNKKKLDFKTAKSAVAVEIISAKRDVSDNNTGTLSSLANKHYSGYSTESDGINQEVLQLLHEINDANIKFTEAYKPIFQDIIEDIAELSYTKKNADIRVISTIDKDTILTDNASVAYEQDGVLLPESYNGLGYLNLFAIIFDMRERLKILSKKDSENKLLIIEEPEAHMHPQMQYIFMKHVREIVDKRAADLKINTQTIVSTHSAQIVSQCDLDNIKYFMRRDDGSIDVKNLSILKESMQGADNAMGFVRQYLKLDKAELFFADKIILIEGDTERLLMSAMMQQLDDEFANTPEYSDGTPLMLQNISVVEVGAFSYKFKELIDFLGIKTLIITDLDSVAKNDNNKMESCPVENGEKSSNVSLKKFLGESLSLKQLLGLQDSDKTLSSDDGGKTWHSDENGKLRLVFQTEGESGYTARSFEDAFIDANEKFLNSNLDKFNSLYEKNKEEFRNCKDTFEKAKLIEKKTTFALDILVNGGPQNTWNTPNYIKEGLKWLQKD